MDLNLKVHSDKNEINSPFLSLLPLSEEYFDLFKIRKLIGQEQEAIFENIFNDTSSITINIPLEITKNDTPKRVGKLSNIQKSFERISQLEGNLSIGYPIVILDDPESDLLISAPLFIWKINLFIEPDSRRLWKMTIPKNSDAFLNPLLQNYLENRYNFIWEDIFGTPDKITQSIITETSISLSQKFNLSFSQSDRITACALASDKPENVVLNSLLIGNFEPIVDEIPKEIEKPKKLSPVKQWDGKIATLPLNSVQYELVQDIFNGHQIVAEGDTKTGKTHVISSVLPSLLASGRSALIISSTPESFNDFYSHLNFLNISEIGILELNDKEKCNDALIEYIEALPKRVPDSKFDYFNHEIKIKQLIDSRTQFHNQYEKINSPIIHDWKWTELVGKALLYNQKSNRQILSNFLDNNIFDFSAEELKLISDELSEHYVHYQKINTLEHSMNHLNDRFFDLNNDYEETFEHIKAEANIYDYKINNLYQNYIVFLGDYRQFLKFEHTDFVENIEQQINNIEKNLSLYRQVYGEAFDKHNNIQNAKLKVLSLFSKHHQGVRLAKEQIVNDYDRLKTYFINADYFDYSLPSIGDEPKLADIESKLEQFRVKLHQWAKTINSLVNNRLINLSLESDIPIVFKERYSYLVQSFNNLIDQLNIARILNIKLNPESYDIYSGKELLLDLNKKLQNIINNWNDSEMYYIWRQSWLALDSKTRIIAQALSNCNSSDWASCFKSWYYHQILLLNYSTLLPRESNYNLSVCENYNTNLAEVKDGICKKAKIITKERQILQLKAVKKLKEFSFSSFRSLLRNAKIKRLVNLVGQDNFKDFFPLVFATPEMSEKLLDNKIHPFDIVIIDNSETMSAESDNLLQLGTQHIIMGQNILEDNLLKSVKEDNIRQYYLLDKTYSENSHTTTKEHPSKPNAFQIAITNFLQDYINKERISYDVLVEDVKIDLLIKSLSEEQKSIAIMFECGMLHGHKDEIQLTKDEYHTLTNAGYSVQYIWSVDCWRNITSALNNLLVFILELDNAK
ncbi:MAG: hypothetical protein MK207_05330 [Saprospiraceae bacterium]|nr:hypothetical protein [Saprospiraceae bacterium]